MVRTMLSVMEVVRHFFADRRYGVYMFILLFLPMLYIDTELEPVLAHSGNWSGVLSFLLIRGILVAIGVTAAFFLVRGERL